MHRHSSREWRARLRRWRCVGSLRNHSATARRDRATTQTPVFARTDRLPEFATIRPQSRPFYARAAPSSPGSIGSGTRRRSGRVSNMRRNADRAGGSSERAPDEDRERDWRYLVGGVLVLAFFIVFASAARAGTGRGAGALVLQTPSGEVTAPWLDTEM